MIVNCLFPCSSTCVCVYFSWLHRRQTGAPLGRGRSDPCSPLTAGVQRAEAVPYGQSGVQELHQNTQYHRYITLFPFGA